MAIKKFLSESGFKHFVEKVIGKTDISSVGDGTLKGAVSSLNLKLDSTNSNISKKQDASTAITTSNIGSQSVNYANSSNYANSAGSANSATKAYQDGTGANSASTYLKGTQNNGDCYKQTVRKHWWYYLWINTNVPPK